MTIVFEPIRPKKISEEIVDQIKSLISKGDLKPGDRIPSERELAVMLGVSRPSVREAIMVLDAMGFLEARQGGGTYVRSLMDASITDPAPEEAVVHGDDRRDDPVGKRLDAVQLAVGKRKEALVGPDPEHPVGSLAE